MKKIITFILALVMLVSLFACVGYGNGTSNTTDEAAGPTGEGTSNVLPELPDVSYNGAAFRISTKENFLATEVWADETAKDIRQQATWERNSAVEDEYDVTIKPITSYDTTVSGHVNELIDILTAEEDVYDIALTYAIGTGPLVTGGYCVNWLNLKYTDLSKRYWINDVNENLTFDDAIYTVVGDMCTTALTMTSAMYYNRSEGDRIKNEDGQSLTEIIYDKIGKKEWTIDFFNTVVSDKYNDIDDVPGRSDGDFYGFTAETLTNLDIYPFAFDLPMISFDDDEIIKVVFNTEKTVTAVDKINKLYWETPGSYCGSDAGLPFNIFVGGRALFCTSWLGRCFSILKNMEEHYSVLPYPMYDEDQGEYLTGAMDNYSMITIPYTEPDLEMVSIVTEALNYESRERMFPVYYEESLQKQYARDPETIEMLDILMDGRNFDLATVMVPGLAMSFRAAVASKTNDFVQFYDQRADSYKSTVARIIEKYEMSKASGK